MDITGTQVKNLKILSEIGEGGMGVVFLATHVILGKKFAVKCLTPELSTSLQFRERFEKEAMAQAALEHPNIVQVSDFFEHKNRYYLVMEYVDGRSLDEMIEHQGKLGEKEALPILKDILAGVNFAHSRGIIHRDIKPSNILIDKSGRAKIMDFGIAIRAGDDHRLTKTGVDIGTAWYVSPEQVINPKGVDHRSDVYSIGVVLFEMLTGQAPFDGETDYSIKDKHVRETPPTVNEIVSDVSAELSGIVMKALEKSPDDRFNGCGEFLEYVEACEHQADGHETTSNSSILEEGLTSEPPVHHEPPEAIFEDPITGMQFAYVQGGKFMMGETCEDESNPVMQVHEVELTGFYMSKHPVTCGQWKHVMGVDPSAFAAGENYPVEMVSWGNAQEFIGKLTAANNREHLFRLPTEAEWEYAARSGGKAEKYAGGDHIDAVAWYDRNSGKSTRPVGEKAPNGLGLHDMSGNVWEWCRDWFGDYPSDGIKSPTGPSVGTQRVLRGGGWDSDAARCQITCRYHNWPEYKDRSWGLRLVRDMAPPEPLATLCVAGSPKGAAIWINGKDTGKKTDTQIELPAGKYKVALTSDGFESSTQAVEAVSGHPTEIEFQLKKAPTSVPVKKKKRTRTSIASAIAGVVCFLCVVVALLLQNADSRKDISHPSGLAEKPRKAPVSRPKVQQTTKPGKMASPQTTSRSALFVATEPDDATVRFLDDPKSFHQGMLLASGRYHLEVSREGCKTREIRVDVEAGKNKNIRIKLEWVIGQFFLETEPKNAHVRFLNVEQEFHQGMLLASGRYDVEVSHEGYGTRKVWMNLIPGEKNRYRIKLEWIMSRLWVTCEPEDAKVRLLNIKQKFTQGIVLEPGRYRVEVSHEGYTPEILWATLTQGKRRTLRVILKKNEAENPPEPISTRNAASPVLPSSKEASENRPHHRFIYDTGVIWDTRTELEWIVGPDEPTTFSEAQEWLTSNRTERIRGGKWRIPTTEELQTLYNKWKGTKRNMPDLFETTGWYVWARKAPGSSEIVLYNFRDGDPADYKFISASYARVFAVRKRKN